ncbi:MULTISPECIES: DUF2069 domain-containing protein [Spongiibacter]|uniref:DUF2069 domain-containing protein n=2 Tax=Spongiibacteraceae TaxID=1706375 RepID=UPI000C3FD128|nr:MULTISPECIES: DUF2069 domain-containing protein [Spongiibacter]MAY40052.1 hypothetical protein [Spongiibacter sp.]MBI58812.1 hypothetical protein [Spongiibacter sp.]|tara:strand:- start:141 stop:521 length:381 start_codon:yes stop_codon:yes gene_type:complete
MSVQQRAAISGAVMKVVYVGLLISLTLSTWVWVQEPRKPSLFIWLVRELPMLLFIVAVFREQLKGLAWLCFLSLLYFARSVTMAMSPFAVWINYVELALVVLLFCSTMAFIRWHAQAQRSHGQDAA